MIATRRFGRSLVGPWLLSSFLHLVVFMLIVALSHQNIEVNSQAQPIPHPQEGIAPPAHQPTAPWYETLPAVAMDYKVIIDPGKEDCYFQFVNPGATFYASAQVRHYSIAKDFI